MPQSRAVMAFESGASIAIIGSAGYGKSFLLRKIISLAHVRYDPSTIDVCALTNQAAAELNGITFHSLVGAPPPSWAFSKPLLLELVTKDPRRVKFLQQLKSVIIEEAFLLTAPMVDSLDYVLRHINCSEKWLLPMEGRQLIYSWGSFPIGTCGFGPRFRY